MLPLRALGKDPYQASLLVAGGLLAILGIPWPGHPDILLYVPVAFSLRVFLCPNFSFL